MSRGNLANVSEIIRNGLKSQWRYVTVLLITQTICGLMPNVAIESIRRMTGAIWIQNWPEAQDSIGLLVLVASVQFASSLLSGAVSFRLACWLDEKFEDSLYHNYINRDYWLDEDKEKMYSHIRKIAPEAAISIVRQLSNGYRVVITLLAGVVYGLLLSPLILFICLLATFVMLLFSRKSLRRVDSLHKEFNDRNGKLYGLLWEQVENREIGGFLRPEKVVKGYEDESKDYLSNLLLIKKVSNGAGLFAQFASTILIVLAAFIGGVSALQSQLSFADLLATIILIPSIASHFFGIPNMVVLWKATKGQVKTIDKILDRPAYDGNQAQSLNQSISRICVKDVSFAYESEYVLRNISFELKTGFYALSGASGSGKSTLIKLFARALPCAYGDIFINNIPFRNLDRNEYWKHLSYINQNCIILPGSLRENIVMGQKGYAEEWLMKVINMAQLQDLVSILPRGLETIIDASKISKGESQRIAIARALYKKSDLLLLDEVMEALDPLTEEKIARALLDFSRQKNVLIINISHRHAASELVDQVIFMQHGEVDSISTHSQLMQKSSAYRILLEGDSE